MNRLDDLIQKYCPNGIEFKKIKEVAEVGTGSSNTKEAIDNGKYPFFVRSQNIKTKNNFEFDEEAIIIPGEGGVGEIFHYINGKYSLHQRVYRIHFIDMSVNTKFIYYYMKAFFKNFILKKAVSATVVSIRKPMINEFKIPIPPLPVQEEIVRILDSFTKLNEKLNEELTKRKNQYEYYRDNLLSFKDKSIYLPLEQILKIKNGKDYKHLNIGKIPVYGTGGIITYVDKYTYNKPSVLIPRKGSLEKLYYLDTPFWNVDTVFYTEIFNNVVEKYVFYCLQKEHLEKLNTAGGVPSLTQRVLNKVRIPVPSLDKQKYIVSILDKFNILCNDLLPAEIEARKKQYEYYRDKLLTFKELKQ